MYRNGMWTEVEDKVLDDYYATEGAIGCKERGLNRSIAAIRVRANKRGIVRLKPSIGRKIERWSDFELSVLREHFKKGGIREVINKGVNKSPIDICLEAQRLDLYK